MTVQDRKLAGTYLNVALGMVHVFEALGWQPLEHVYSGIHHGDYGCMLYWPGDGEPAYPENWKQISITEELTARVALITGDRPDERYITLSVGDGTFQRWKLDDEQLKSLFRDISKRLFS